MFFFERVPQPGHLGVESSEKDCTFSNSSLHCLHRYWYVGIAVSSFVMVRPIEYWAATFQQQPPAGCSLAPVAYDVDVSITLAGLAVMFAAYFSGSFPTASAVGRLSGHDHSKEGSGNPGASNVWRISGKAFGIITVVVDILKSVVPVAVALLVASRPWAAGAWATATIGHIVPVARWRSGGKGVATAGGGALVLFPLLSLALIALFVVIVQLTKRASLGSLTITALLVVGVGFLHQHIAEVVAVVSLAAVIFLRHRSNIGRLLSGEELKVS